MLVVDAYNVLQTTGVLPPELAGPDVEDLARLIGASRYGRRRVLLVCDGTRKGETAGGAAGRVEVVYAGAGREADDAIEGLVARSGGGRGVTVVSSDGRLRRAARRARSKWLSSEAFLGQITRDVTGSGGRIAGRRPGASGSRAGERAGGRPAFATAVPLNVGQVAAWAKELGLRPGDAVWKLKSSAGQVASTQSADRKVHGYDGVSIPWTGSRNAHTEKSLDAVTDPLLMEAARVWAGRLRLDELDMERWLDGQEEHSGGRPM